MLPYISISAMPVLVACLFKNLHFNEKQKKRYLITCGIILVLFLGLRSRYLGSSDTYSYYELFKYARNTISWDNFYSFENTDYSGFKNTEIGFLVFTYFLSRITSNPQVLIFITSALFISSVMLFIYYNSNDIIMSVVMYITLGLMTFEMQGMRQSIAMSICLIAFLLFQKKKYIHFILVVFLATMFHQTAVVFFAIVLLSRFAVNLKDLSFFCIGTGLILFFLDKIIIFVNELFGRHYYDTAENGGYIAVAIYVLIIVYALLFNSSLKLEQSKSVMFYMLLFGFLCYTIRYFGVQAAERISFYFMFAQLVILPNSIINTKASYQVKGVLKIVVYFLCVLLMIYRLNDSELVPYRFF